MGVCIRSKTVGFFCLFLCLVLSDLTALRADSESVENNKNKNNKIVVERPEETGEDSSASVTKSAESVVGKKEGGLEGIHPALSSAEDHDERGWGSPLSAGDGDGDVSDEEDGDDGDDREDQDTVKFSAVISTPRPSQRPTPCRRHQPAVKFDTTTTTTTTTQDYNPHTATFTAPFGGLYLFSVNIQLRHDNLQRHRLHDVHIVTVTTDSTKGAPTVVCSISSSQNGGPPGLDSVSVTDTHQGSEDHREDLHFAKWGFEDELGTRLRRKAGWDRAPQSAWEVNWRTEGEVEGFCEGVKHLGKGQRVFVRLGNLDEDHDYGADDDDEYSEEVGDNGNEDGKICDITGGFFSGSLLTMDV